MRYFPKQRTPTKNLTIQIMENKSCTHKGIQTLYVIAQNLQTLRWKSISVCG